MFDPLVLRADFPILNTPLASGKPLTYLDSAATSQKPQAVLDAIINYYTHANANVHRGIHELGDRATKAWGQARQTVADFFGALPEELVITRNTTEALNQAAYMLESQIKAGDLLIATQMDHHSNLVPWQELARRKGARLELVPVTEDGLLDLVWFENLLKTKKNNIKIVAFPHVSNTLGTVNPVEQIVKIVRASPLPLAPYIVLDAAQSAPHLPVDFHALDIDFMAVSAHKMLGPMGIGGLFVKKTLLASLSPWLFGGGMIDEVGETSATFAQDLGDRFTPGTPDVASVVGWAAACDYLSKLGMPAVCEHDQAIVEYTLKALAKIPEIKVVGPQKQRSGSVTFLYHGVHAHDVAQVLSSEGVAVRSGHHCTMPLHKSMGWAATTRASFNVYTTKADIDALVKALQKVASVFA